MRRAYRHVQQGKLPVLGAALALASALQAAEVTVNIVNFSFQPASVSINAEDSVIWKQGDTTRHSSTSDSGVWDSGLLSLNNTFTNTFTSAGTFPYHCSPHPFMKGNVTVKAAANQPPSVTITSPANGAALTDPNVTFQAEASDPDGTVAQVQFFEGRTSLGTATSSPFQITVSLDAGTHNISAQATDNQGATASSAVVTITINAGASAPTLSGAAKTTDGKFQFTVNGTAGRTYLVQVSSDAQTWQVLQTIPANSDVFTVTDSLSNGAGPHFYRVALQQ